MRVERVHFKQSQMLNAKRIRKETKHEGKLLPIDIITIGVGWLCRRTNSDDDYDYARSDHDWACS
jgi:hypothetical protein